MTCGSVAGIDARRDHSARQSLVVLDERALMIEERTVGVSKYQMQWESTTKS